MAAKAIILAACAVAIAPAVVAIAWQSPDKTGLTRAVATSGPITSFNQSHNRIQVRLKPAATEAERIARSQVIVADADGDQFAIPLKRGQTWVSAELPHSLVDSSSLKISVE